MKKLDLLLISMPRSGSTLLANLLTYNNNWCMVEPHSDRNIIKSWVAKQARALGRHFRLRKFSELPEQMKSFEKFGIKEIHKRHYMLVSELFAPTHYIILLRDVGDIFLSLKNFHYTIKDSDKILMERIYEWWYDLHSFFKTIPDKQSTVIYYDDLLNETYRELLGQRLKWPLNGKPDLWLDDYNRGNEKRNNEIKKRKYDITDSDTCCMLELRKECKKKLFSTLLIQNSSVMIVEDIIKGDADV